MQSNKRIAASIKNMLTGTHLILLLATLISRADCLGSKETLVQLASENLPLVIIVLLLVNLLIATIYEVRNGYRFTNFLREKINLLKNRLAEMRKAKEQQNQKVLTEQAPQSSKNTVQIFDSQKSYGEADIASIQETIQSPSNREAMRSMEIIEEGASQVNLKEVFQNKDTKSSHKRSKSKLRSKVQYRKQISEASPVNDMESTGNQSLQNSPIE